MPVERAHNRTTPLIAVYDPKEDYSQPSVDINEITRYLENYALFEEWLITHPEAS